MELHHLTKELKRSTCFLTPPYLGEILIYLAYATLSMHWLPFLIIAAWVFGFFARNMAAKDRSLSRHPGFEDYRKSSGLLFPRLF